MRKLYLDSSTIAKRYVAEPGTATTDLLYEQAERGGLLLAFSIWNVGEVLSVFDRRCRQGWLAEGEFSEALRMFAGETSKLLRLKALEIIPMLTPVLTGSWGVILNRHVDGADAVQITSCLHAKSDALLSADKELIHTSRELGLTAFDVTSEEDELARFLKGP